MLVHVQKIFPLRSKQSPVFNAYQFTARSKRDGTNLQAVLLRIELCREIIQNLLMSRRQPLKTRLVLLHNVHPMFLVVQESLNHALKVFHFRISRLQMGIRKCQGFRGL